MNKKGVIVEYGIPFMYCLFIIMLIFGIGLLCLSKVRISVYQQCCSENGYTYYENGTWFKSGDYCYDGVTYIDIRKQDTKFCRLLNISEITNG